MPLTTSTESSSTTACNAGERAVPLAVAAAWRRQEQVSGGHRSRWGESPYTRLGVVRPPRSHSQEPVGREPCERERARARARERERDLREGGRAFECSSRVRQGFASERTSKGWKSRERGRSGAKPQQMSTSSGTIPSESCSAEPSAVPSAMSIRPRYAIDMAA